MGRKPWALDHSRKNMCTLLCAASSLFSATLLICIFYKRVYFLDKKHVENNTKKAKHRLSFLRRLTNPVGGSIRTPSWPPPILSSALRPHTQLQCSSRTLAQHPATRFMSFRAVPSASPLIASRCSGSTTTTLKPRCWRLKTASVCSARTFSPLTYNLDNFPSL